MIPQGQKPKHLTISKPPPPPDLPPPALPPSGIPQNVKKNATDNNAKKGQSEKKQNKKAKKGFFWRFLFLLVTLGIVGGVALIGLIAFGIFHYGKDLPNHRELSDYSPPTSTRVHAGNGSLMGEFALEKRIFVPIASIPQRLVNGFISAEDKRFYSHIGLDFIGIARAVIQNIINLFQDRRMVGASTITQQVAKNFLLTNEVSFERKIKEAILALRIERSLSKDEIMELYLNEIYLGKGAYGVAAAALIYFDKSLEELSYADIAYLAALPKAPSNYHPERRRQHALNRRNWVLSRMAEEGFIDETQRQLAQTQPLIGAPGEGAAQASIIEADYFLEEVRRELLARFGEDGLYHGGLSARTTLDPKLQNFAETALRDGLEAYDRRHGWRGALQNIDLAGFADANISWQEALSEVKAPMRRTDWSLAVVRNLNSEAAIIGLEDGSEGQISLQNMLWARRDLGEPNDGLGPNINAPEDVLAIGDVIFVKHDEADQYLLRQIPEINGGLVALDPHTGRVWAMVGGYDFDKSEFNRALQAERQPGSAIKPFVYLAALENGFSPSTIILDAPFVIDQGAGLGKWKPSNFSNRFYGPSLMRVGIENSRNLMTVRLAQTIGMEAVTDVVGRFGIDENMPPHLSMALGAGVTELMDLTAAYGKLVNGGKDITPTLIDRVQDRFGNTIFRHDQRQCLACMDSEYQGQPPPKLPDDRLRLTDPIHAYQIVSMLRGAVERGTGVALNSLNHIMAGKTGTTNESRDSWFIGFTPDLVVGVYTGFDTPVSLGRRPDGRQETGSSVALPIFKNFMEKAIQDKPNIPFRIPDGTRFVRIDGKTGGLATPQSEITWQEAFVPGSEPQSSAPNLFIGDDDQAPQDGMNLPSGIY